MSHEVHLQVILTLGYMVQTVLFDKDIVNNCVFKNIPYVNVY